MAITVKYLEGLGIEKEIAEKIFQARGEEIEAEKHKYSELEQKFNEKSNDFNTLTTEFENLKKSNATVEDYKKKFEDLQEEIKKNEQAAEAERIAKEKAAAIETRFNAVVGEKKFNHEAIRADYLDKFSKALDNTDNVGKSDTDIFHELIKDDAAAFEGVKVFQLKGGTDKSFNNVAKFNSKADIMKIKDTTERQNAIANNIELFQN